METFADCVCLQILDEDWYRLDTIAYQVGGLERRGCEVRSLVVSDFKRSCWLPCKPKLFETHLDLSASMVVNLYNLAKCCEDVDDGQCLGVGLCLQHWPSKGQLVSQQQCRTRE
jgi:hypothetical protein